MDTREELTERVLGFGEEMFDAAALAGLLDEAMRSPRLLETLAAMLRSEDIAHVRAACWLVYEGTAPAVDPLRLAFLRSVQASPVLTALQDLVFSPSLARRTHAIWVLGRAGGQGSLPVLYEAFGYWRERDPLLMRRLLGEISWLGGAERGPGGARRRVARLLDSDGYLTRWAALETSGQRDGDVLDRLSDDPEPLVAAEARFVREEQRAREAAREIPKPERRRFLKAVGASRPAVTFGGLEVRFGNHLAQTGADAYAVAELDAFARRWAADSLIQ